jgi:hypothetical protein
MTLLPSASLRFIGLLTLGLGGLPLVSGCTVLTVAGAVTGAAVSVTASVVTTGVEVTGKAVGATIDAVSGPSKDAD